MVARMDDANVIEILPAGQLVWQADVDLPPALREVAMTAVRAAAVHLPRLVTSPMPWVVGVRWCDEAEGRRVNAAFRGKDYATNVLSFGTDDDAMEADEEEWYVGDLLICWPILLREAAEQDKDVLHHASHMLVHGLLHLNGYDHETPAEAEAMEALEVKILSELNIPNPYEDSDPC